MADDDLASILAHYGHGQQAPDPGADEVYSTVDVLRSMRAPKPWFTEAMRHLASFIPVDDREDRQRGRDEPWANWWARSNLDSGLGPAIPAVVKGGLNTSASWLEGKPEIGPDTLAPLGLAAMGIPLGMLRGAGRAMERAPKEWAPEFMGPHRADDPWSRNPAAAPREMSAMNEMIARAEETSARRNGLVQRLDNLPPVAYRDVLPSDLPIEKYRPITGDDLQGWLVKAPKSELGVVEGHADPSSKTFQILGSALPLDQRGRGYGLAMYQRLIDEAHRLGYTVQSDTTVSPSARHIYDALERRGYDVQRHPNAAGKDTGGINTPGYDTPVFTVKPPRTLLANPASAALPGAFANAASPDVQRLLEQYSTPTLAELLGGR